jgi:hypothetical protein
MAEGRTARYYRTGSTVKGKGNAKKASAARKKKADYDKKFNARPEQKAKRRELAKARRKRGIMGKGGDDLHHTKSGHLVKMSPSKNRGNKEKSRLKGSKRS